MAKCMSARRVLEVGAGAGLAAKIFVQSLMAPGSQYFITDIAEGMISETEKAINESGWLDQAGHKMQRLREDMRVDLATLEPEVKDKSVFPLVADAMSLPFPDETFDSYTSQLTIPVVPEPKKMVSEAYRVLKKGGITAISAVGRENHTEFIGLYQDVVKATFPDLAVKCTQETDYQEMKEMFVDAGFSSVKLFYNE